MHLETPLRLAPTVRGPNRSPLARLHEVEDQSALPGIPVDDRCMAPAHFLPSILLVDDRCSMALANFLPGILDDRCMALAHFLPSVLLVDDRCSMALANFLPRILDDRCMALAHSLRGTVNSSRPEIKPDGLTCNKIGSSDLANITSHIESRIIFEIFHRAFDR